MELRHLRYFLAVAEELNFTRAAQRLHIAQPPLSRQIHALEEELGVDLFKRQNRSVTLTDAGRVLLRESRLLLSQAAAIIDKTRRASSASLRRIRVAFAAGLGETFHSVLVRHLLRYPDAEVQYRDLLSARQNNALLERHIDVGLLRPPITSPLLTSEILYRERLLALVPKRSPLARLRRLHVRQLQNETLLLHDRRVSAGVYDKILELIQDAGIQPAIVQTRTGPYEEAGTVLVASGQGIYIGASAVLSHPVFGREVKTVPLADPQAFINVSMAWRKDEASPEVLAFLATARNVLKKSKS